MKTIKRLTLKKIRIDSSIQAREEANEGTIAEYAEAMAEGAKFPPVIVFDDGIESWLADGFHRVAAACRAGLLEIDAEVRQGGKREAILCAVAANASHGLRRSNGDKRKSVKLMLEDEEWRSWNDREIARHCGVSHTFVAKIRAELSGNGCQMQVRKVERGGTTYPMHTSEIGRHGGGVEKQPIELMPATLRGEDVLEYFCSVCEAAIDRPIWHCPRCDKHLLPEMQECVDCEHPRPGITANWVVVGERLFMTPFAHYPDMQNKSWQDFKESVRNKGFVSQILVDENDSVIDGRQRLRAAAELGLELRDSMFDVRTGLSDLEKLGLCSSRNRLRTHLEPNELMAARAKIDGFVECAQADQAGWDRSLFR